MDLKFEDNIRIFKALFFADVESWFSRDIACCDACYEDFLAAWPYAYSADEARFQCDSIPLDAFYDGSRHLSDFCTKEQFNEYLPHIQCPNCGEPLRHWIWPYELPFTPPKNHEVLIEEISDVANRTPFLLLLHPFANQVFEAITSLSKQTSPETFDMRLFRARVLDQGHPVTIADFDFPPRELVHDGRYNHAGDSVLYLASTEKVCKAEMRGVAPLKIASFDFCAKLKILDLMEPHESKHQFADLLAFISFSALVSAQSMDHGYHRPEYVFSRFIKDCALQAGFNAIKFPSTRVGFARFNIVIIDPELILARCAKNFCLQQISNLRFGDLTHDDVPAF